MKFVAPLILSLIALPALGKLPPPPEEVRVKAAEAASKAAWGEKVGQYQTCRAQDRVAEGYRKTVMAAGRMVLSPTSTPPCTDPGTYGSTPLTPVANKPLEAAEAHSPPGAAVSPPSTKATAAEIAGGIKKGGPN